MPNAANNVTVDTTGKTIFATPEAAVFYNLNPVDCLDMRGALSITIYNSGANDAEVNCDQMHASVARWLGGTIPSSQWMPLPSGKSVTLELRREPGAAGQIERVRCRAATGTTTIGWGVTACGAAPGTLS